MTFLAFRKVDLLLEAALSPNIEEFYRRIEKYIESRGLISMDFDRRAQLLYI